ncbi:MAG: site-specific integrase [Flavobacterium sp.]|nr:site-specific integrase [Flavobacterium sp.]
MLWKAKLIVHKGESRIAMQIKSNSDDWNIVRELEDSRWSQSRKCWHLPDTEENRRRFNIQVAPKFKPSPEAIERIEKFKLWLQSRRYSANTVKTYIEAAVAFFSFYHDRAPSTITNDDIITFNNDFIIARNLSAAYQNQVVNALKLFFLIAEEKYIDPNLIHRPKRIKLLPNVLSKQEVKMILEAPINHKHRMVLTVIYACGLRRSEAINLEFTDLQSDRNLLVIRQSKGNKDRVVPISNKLIDLLREYYKLYRPKKYFFEGLNPGEKMSTGTLQSILRQALLRSGISKPVTLHWLRHSYATHLLESGTDLRYIQELLGHNSSRTTEIYTHVSNHNIQRIKSPFDDL